MIASLSETITVVLRIVTHSRTQHAQAGFVLGNDVTNDTWFVAMRSVLFT